MTTTTDRTTTDRTTTTKLRPGLVVRHRDGTIGRTVECYADEYNGHRPTWRVEVEPAVEGWAEDDLTVVETPTERASTVHRSEVHPDLIPSDELRDRAEELRRRLGELVPLAIEVAHGVAAFYDGLGHDRDLSDTVVYAHCDWLALSDVDAFASNLGDLFTEATQTPGEGHTAVEAVAEVAAMLGRSFPIEVER